MKTCRFCGVDESPARIEEVCLNRIFDVDGHEWVDEAGNPPIGAIEIIDMSGPCPDCDYEMPAPVGAKEPTRAWDDGQYERPLGSTEKIGVPIPDKNPKFGGGCDL